MRTKPKDLPRIPTQGQIREHRARLKMSRPAYAALVGVSEMTIYRWEMGLNVPRGLALRALVRMMGRAR